MKTAILQPTRTKTLLWCWWPCPAAQRGDAVILSSFTVLQRFVHWSTFLNMQWCCSTCCAMFSHHRGVYTCGLLANLCRVTTLNLTTKCNFKKWEKKHPTAGLFVPFSCLSNREWAWCAGKIYLRFRIHLSQVQLTAPERTGPDRQATSPVSEYERHEWTIWSHCVDFGTERTKVYTVYYWKTC